MHVSVLVVLAAVGKERQGVRSIDRLLRKQGLPLSKEPNAMIAMSDSEGGYLIQSLLRPTTRTYVEWGSGGSTELVSWLILAGLTQPNFLAVSIESSARWVSYMRNRSTLIRRAERGGQLRLIHGAMGDVGHLGYPKAFLRSDHKRALGYVGLDTKLAGRKVDLALVDGRFRLACMLEVFSHLCHENAMPRVLLHDYAVILPGLSQRRFNEYSLALNFYDYKWRNDTLATLVPKRNVSLAALAAARTRALGHPD